jgi:hypothetical protein
MKTQDSLSLGYQYSGRQVFLQVVKSVHCGYGDRSFDAFAKVEI